MELDQPKPETKIPEAKGDLIHLRNISASTTAIKEIEPSVKGIYAKSTDETILACNLSPYSEGDSQDYVGASIDSTPDGRIVTLAVADGISRSIQGQIGAEKSVEYMVSSSSKFQPLHQMARETIDYIHRIPWEKIKEEFVKKSQEKFKLYTIKFIDEANGFSQNGKQAIGATCLSAVKIVETNDGNATIEAVTFGDTTVLALDPQGKIIAYISQADISKNQEAPYALSSVSGSAETGMYLEKILIPKGTRILVCSDGLYKLLLGNKSMSTDAIRDGLAKILHKDPTILDQENLLALIKTENGIDDDLAVASYTFKGVTSGNTAAYPSEDEKQEPALYAEQSLSLEEILRQSGAERTKIQIETTGKEGFDIFGFFKAAEQQGKKYKIELRTAGKTIIIDNSSGRVEVSAQFSQADETFNRYLLGIIPLDRGLPDYNRIFIQIPNSNLHGQLAYIDVAGEQSQQSQPSLDPVADLQSIFVQEII